jgi:monoterpene epsilon-lactone hydrolase
MTGHRRTVLSTDGLRGCLIQAVSVGLFCFGPVFLSVSSAADPVDRSPPSSLSPEWTKLWPMIVAQGQLSKSIVLPAPNDLKGWTSFRQRVEKLIEPSVPGVISGYGVGVQSAKLNEVPVLWITPRNWVDDGRILIYVHGGGFTNLSARSTLSASALMANRSGIRVVSVDYTPAPAARWREITDQVTSVYRALLKSGQRSDGIGLWGDSAGGSIAAGTALKLRDQGLPLPGAVMLWAPWADVAMQGDTYTTLAAADPLLAVPSLKASAAAYADPADQKNPYVSPVYGNYAKGFPPTLVQGGTREILLSDSIRQYQAMVQSGVPAVLDLYEGMVHVFQPMAPDSAEGRAAMARAVAFWDLHLRRGPAAGAEPGQRP